MPWRGGWVSGQCDSQGPDAAAAPGTWLSTEESLVQSSLADAIQEMPQGPLGLASRRGYWFLHRAASASKISGQGNHPQP